MKQQPFCKLFSYFLRMRIAQNPTTNKETRTLLLLATAEKLSASRYNKAADRYPYCVSPQPYCVS